MAIINSLKKLTVIVAALVAFAAASDSQSVSVGGRNARTADPQSRQIDRTQLLRDVQYLASDELEGRSADRPSIAKARDFIERRFREAGLSAFGESYRQQFVIKYRSKAATDTGVNFVGYIKGRRYPKNYIVVTAHYDHDGVKGGAIYNGADDNASGTAALFALASAFKKVPPDHSIIIVAFDGEEKGLQGSRYFLANLPVKKESIILNVNMDMISRNEKGELYAAGTYHYPDLKPALIEAQKKAKVKLILGHDDPELGDDDWTDQSDHSPFHGANIPFVYFGVEDHADYHRPTDDFERIMPDFYVKAVETVLSAILLLDKRIGK